MITILDIKNDKIAEQVLNIQLPAYEVEAKLMNFYEIPPLHDTVEKLTQSDETFYGFWENGILAGVISVEAERKSLQICRLVVHPNYFRKGIARQLVSFIFKNYKDIQKFIVSTGERNIPAKNLYTSLGFFETKNIEIEPNVYITCFEKGPIALFQK